MLATLDAQTDYEMRKSQLERDVKKLRTEYGQVEESVAALESELRKSVNPYSRQKLGELLTKKQSYFTTLTHSLSDAVGRLDSLTVEALVPPEGLRRKDMSDTQKIEVIKQHGSAYYNRIPL